MKEILFLIATVAITFSMFTVCNENDVELAQQYEAEQVELIIMEA